MAQATFPPPQHDHGACLDRTLERAERACAREGVRLTPLRREVLEIIASGHEALGAYDILERMGRDGSRPAPITVYRVLDFLRARGLVHKVESKNAFIACTRDEDHADRTVLLICEGCGLVAELEAADVLKALAASAARHGFAIERPVIEMSGSCARCSRSA